MVKLVDPPAEKTTLMENVRGLVEPFAATLNFTPLPMPVGGMNVISGPDAVAFQAPQRPGGTLIAGMMEAV